MSAELSHTFLTIMRGTETNRFGDETDVGVPIIRHLPAAMAETSHTTFDRASQTRRTIRNWTCVVAAWAGFTTDDTLRVELTGNTYLIESIQRQPSLIGAPADLILTLRERTGVSVHGDG
jgi:hypothetical protein